MIQVDIRGMDVIKAAMQGMSQQMPFIISSALNTAAFAVRTAEQARILSELAK